MQQTTNVTGRKQRGGTPLALPLALVLVLVSACSKDGFERWDFNAAATTAEPTTTVAPAATAAPVATAEPTTTAAPARVLSPTTTAAPAATAEPTTTAAPARVVSPTTTVPIPPHLGGDSRSATTSTLLPLDPPTFESVSRINTILDFTDFVTRGKGRWERSVPGIEDIRIISTADGAEQPALWLAPTGERDQPLLVVLHSWSTRYTQHAGIPFAMWAQENGWAVIAPEFRGINDDADAIGSDLAVQDVVDAIDYAIAQDGVDGRRVYAVGYSGGGMMSLLMAGRHPEKVTAVAAWGPPNDLVDFYRQSRRNGQRYDNDIWRACGGDPREPGPAQEECLRRSPMTYLESARDQEVPIFIGQGILDPFVYPSQGAKAFNQLADPGDRLSVEEVEEIGRGRLPDHLSGMITTETYFGEGDPEPVFARQSGAVWLVFFQAHHDMVYQAALRWFASDPR